MNLIEATFKAIDFHMYDRQGHELTLWRHDDDHLATKQGAVAAGSDGPSANEAEIQPPPG